MSKSSSQPKRLENRFGVWGLLALCTTSITPCVDAQDYAGGASSDRFYAGLDAGAAFVTDFNLITESPLELPFLKGFGPVIVPAGLQQPINMDPGARVNGSFGVRLLSNLSFEIQPGWIWSSGSGPAFFETLGPDPENPAFSLAISRSEIELTQLPLLGSFVGTAPISNRWNVRAGFGVGVVFSNLSVDYTLDYFNDSDYGRIQTRSDSDYDASVAWQAKVGVEYSVTDELTVGAGYQFLFMGQAEWLVLGGELSTPNLYTHSVMAVATLKF